MGMVSQFQKRSQWHPVTGPTVEASGHPPSSSSQWLVYTRNISSEPMLEGWPTSSWQEISEKYTKKQPISKRQIRKTRCGMMWVPDCWANDLRNTGPGTLGALKMVGVSGTSRHSCAEKQGTGDEASNLGQLHSDKPTLNIQLMKHGHPKSWWFHSTNHL